MPANTRVVRWQECPPAHGMLGGGAGQPAAGRQRTARFGPTLRTWCSACAAASARRAPAHAAAHPCAPSPQCFEESGRKATAPEVRVWIYGTWHDVDAIMVHPGAHAAHAARTLRAQRATHPGCFSQ